MVFENFYFLAVVFFGFKVSNGDLLVFMWLYVLQNGGVDAEKKEEE